MFDGKTVNGGASVEVTALLLGATVDLSKATGGIELSGTATDSGGGADALIKANNNATITLSADQSGGLEINADNDVTNTATVYLQGTLNLVIAENQSGIIVIDPSAASTDGFDTVNVTATKAVTGLDLRTASTTTITLAGSKTVTVDNTATGKSLNASAMTAALTAEATANLLSVTGGSGNDVLTSDATGATIVVNAGAGNDTVDVGGAVTGTFSGGDGTDTLDITGAVDISAATISGFETIDVNTNAVTLATDMLSGQSLVVDGTGSIILNDIGATVDLGSLSFASTLTATGVSVDFSGANRSTDLGAGAAFTYTGSSQIDTVTGGSGDDTIFGGAGADTIVGNAGDNYLDGGAGNDSITSTTGDDTIFGQANDDTISSGAGDDTVDGGTGDDTINGEAGDDSLVGGTGVDTITGGDGVDSVDLTETTSSIDTVVIAAVVGTSGDSDRVTATGNNNDTGEDTITGFKWGTDVIKISATAVASFVHGTDTTIGTATGDVNDGTAGSFLTTVGLVELNQTTNNDWDDLGDIALTFASPSASVSEARFEAALKYDLTAAAAGSTITGGDLADILTAGAGVDILSGGSGADTYKWTAIASATAVGGLTAADTDSDAAPATTEEITDANEIDVITWVDGSDLIDLSGIDADTGTAGNQAFTALNIDNTAVTGTSDGIVLTGTDGQIDLQTGVWDAANGDFTHTAAGADAIIVIDDGTTVAAIIIIGGATLTAADFIL
jgi:Ca2+-binding RTX toxin-like protein